MRANAEQRKLAAIMFTDMVAYSATRSSVCFFSGGQTKRRGLFQTHRRAAFVNMTSDNEQDYFSDGLSEELLTLDGPGRRSVDMTASNGRPSA
jgi:hypothetical protein